LSFSALLILSIGLAMDATAVAAARGLATPNLMPRHFLVAALFGTFHSVMPLVGWLLGSRVESLVQAWQAWVAFGLLAAIGGKMLWEAVKGEPAQPVTDLYGLKVLLVLGVATSIDALAVGVTLPMLEAPLVLSLVTIGLTTAVLSAMGLSVGRRFGALLGRRLDAGGGVMLISVAFKCLATHLLTP
jgi:manganese efflux pump family protein